MIFHGPVPRNKLGNYYDLGDFAIESLGAHRRKVITYSYSIKSREYLAKGMPFIFSTPIDLGQYEPIPYCFKVSEDEQLIDVNALIDYYRALYRQHNETEVAEQLREYAERWVGLDHALIGGRLHQIIEGLVVETQGPTICTLSGLPYDLQLIRASTGFLNSDI